MNSIFISTTEIMDQSDGSTDLIDIILLWHVTSDRVRTYSSRYMTSILNSRRECRQSFTYSSRYILKSSDIWMTISFCSYGISSTLSLSLSLLKSISSSEGVRLTSIRSYVPSFIMSSPLQIVHLSCFVPSLSLEVSLTKMTIFSCNETCSVIRHDDDLRISIVLLCFIHVNNLRFSLSILGISM